MYLDCMMFSTPRTFPLSHYNTYRIFELKMHLSLSDNFKILKVTSIQPASHDQERDGLYIFSLPIKHKCAL